MRDSEMGARGCASPCSPPEAFPWLLQIHRPAGWHLPNAIYHPHAPPLLSLNCFQLGHSLNLHWMQPAVSLLGTESGPRGRVGGHPRPVPCQHLCPAASEGHRAPLQKVQTISKGHFDHEQPVFPLELAASGVPNNVCHGPTCLGLRDTLA